MTPAHVLRARHQTRRQAPGRSASVASLPAGCLLLQQGASADDILSVAAGP